MINVGKVIEKAIEFGWKTQRTESKYVYIRHLIKETTFEGN